MVVPSQTQRLHIGGHSSMKLIATCLALAQVLTCVNAGSCQKDSCYNNVAGGSNKFPSIAVRRADCNALFQAYIDDLTRIITSTATVVPTTNTVISTATTITQRFNTTEGVLLNSRVQTIATIIDTLKKIYTIPTDPVAEVEAEPRLKRAAATLMLTIDSEVLEIRDTLVMKGKKPAYVSQCRNVQEYEYL